MTPLKIATEARQHSEHILFEVTRAQFDANGGTVQFEAPESGILIAGSVSVVTAFNGTSPTLDIGDVDDDNRYSGTPIAGTVGRTVLTPTAYVYGEGENTVRMQVRLNGGAGGTAGKVRVHLEFVKLGVSHHTTGNDSAPTIPPNPGPHA